MMIPTLANTGSATPCMVTCLDLSKIADTSYIQRRFVNNITSNSWIHTFDLILPADVAEAVKETVHRLSATHSYSSLSMTLHQVISGDFFDHFVKKGNVLLLSEGEPLVDNRFTLKDGTLRLELDKQTYERCGLVGEPTRSKGKIHIISRYVIEYDLRQSSMVRGKKGFDRLIWACQNVLNTKISWLFVDLENGENNFTQDFETSKNFLQAKETCIANVIIPFNLSPENYHDTLYQEQLLEWIGLVLIDCPRIQSNDVVDPYICRYYLPEAFESNKDNEKKPETGTNIVHFRWNGLICFQFVRKILQISEKQAANSWIAATSKGIDGRVCMSLLTNQNMITWDMP